MAKITPNSLIQSISGGICKHDGTYMATNRQTGKTYAVKRCNPYDGPQSEAQKAQCNKFGQQSKLAGAWLKANKPKDKDDLGTENYQLLQRAYRSQHKVGNILAYLRTLMTEDGRVMLGDLDITGEIQQTGGGQTPGGNQGGGTTPPSVD